MDRIPVIGVMTLLCVALMAPGMARAQARGPSVNEIRERTAVEPEAARAVKLAELEDWLRRLVGRYRTGEGQWQRLSDCVAVGTGPGVHCVRGVATFTPTMTLYGVDPDAPGIRYLEVNGNSIAEGDLGKLRGNTVHFSRIQCPTTLNRQARTDMTTCERQLRIYAPPEGRYVLIQQYTAMRVFVPTPPSGKRPPGMPVTRLVEFTQDYQMTRIPQD